MKLLAYDNCPYCSRTRTFIGYFGVDCPTEFLACDDVETTTQLVGKKVVPVLIKDDNTPMMESLDIIEELHSNFASDRPLNKEVRPLVQEWVDSRLKKSHYLMMPRATKLPLPEFPTQSAIDAYIQVKEAYIGPFDEHLAKTDEYINDFNEAFVELESLIEGDGTFQKEFSYEDIYLFPILRNLTMAKGITFPPKLKLTVEKLSASTGLALYTDQAI